MLFYTQCCDVNQPLHPLVRGIPTLGEASGSGSGHWNLCLSFPGSWLGQGRAQGAAMVGCPAAAPSSVLPAPHDSHATALSALQPLNFRTLHTAFQIQPQKSLSLWDISSPSNIPSKLSAPRTSCCHPSWTLLPQRTKRLSALAGKIHI